jgi:hypothetical protein
MDITQNKLQQIIIQELRGALGMEQEYTGSEADVDAENDLAGALISLKAADYTREEVIEMVNNEFDEPLQEDCGCPHCPEHGHGSNIRVKVR